MFERGTKKRNKPLKYFTVSIAHNISKYFLHTWTINVSRDRLKSLNWNIKKINWKAIFTITFLDKKQNCVNKSVSFDI